MEKTHCLILLFSLIFIYGCSKSTEPDLRTECQKENVGYFIFDNSSNDAYDVFVNSVYWKQQPGNTISSKIKYKAGTSYTIKVQQSSGYIIYPTVKTFTKTLNQCDEVTITYP